MGWNIDIRSATPIAVEDVRDIVANLPPWLSRFGNPEQDWGWSCGVDVLKPKGCELGLHGAYAMSGKLAKPAARHFKKALKKHGYKMLKTRYSW